jgi:hypothetical protein
MTSVNIGPRAATAGVESTELVATTVVDCATTLVLAIAKLIAVESAVQISFLLNNWRGSCGFMIDNSKGDGLHQSYAASTSEQLMSDFVRLLWPTNCAAQRGLRQGISWDELGICSARMGRFQAEMPAEPCFLRLWGTD